MAQSYRSITESRVLAAMSHPLRRRLLDALTVDGPSTATMLAERTGQAVGNISHHMKVLAEAELVEQVPALARDRRERWWQVSDASLRWSTSSFEEDPAAAAVADAALALSLEHHVAKVRAWNARRESEDQAWQDAAFSTDTWLQLTPGELAELSGDIVSLLRQWRERTASAGPDGRQPVFVFAHGVPAVP